MTKKHGTSKHKSQSSKPGDVELRERNKHALSMRRMDLVERLGKYTVVMLGIVGFAYCGIYLPVEASAGQTTTISYVVNFLSKVKADVVISWVATAGTSMWAMKERGKRISEREAKDKRIKKLEEQVDPSRSSSNLSPSGESQQTSVQDS